MGSKLSISKDANKGIEDIVHYIAFELGNPLAAEVFLDDVEKSYRIVVNNPKMYSLCSDVRLSNKGYRKIVIKNYFILFRANVKEKVVFMEDFSNERSDLD